MRTFFMLTCNCNSFLLLFFIFIFIFYFTVILFIDHGNGWRGVGGESGNFQNFLFLAFSVNIVDANKLVPNKYSECQ